MKDLVEMAVFYDNFYFYFQSIQLVHQIHLFFQLQRIEIEAKR